MLVSKMCIIIMEKKGCTQIFQMNPKYENSDIRNDIKTDHETIYWK